MPVNSAALKAYQKTLITPATLQRALVEAKGQLEDRDIFLSPAYHKQVNSLGNYLVGRTGRKDISVAARVIWDEYSEEDYALASMGLKQIITAYTDNKTAVINAAYPRIQKLLRRSDRHYCVMGMACHEFAHCIFTDFTLLEKQYKAFMDGKLYPHTPKETPANANGLKGIREYLDKGKRTREMVFSIYKKLDNSIEDGYIERSLVALHPGDAKKSLRILNQAFFGKDFMADVKAAYSDDPDYFNGTWSIFTNALLTLIKTGSVNIELGFHDYLDDINNRIAALAPRIMREMENSNALSRKELCLDIILENWDLIEKQVEAQQAQGSELELSDDLLAEILGAIIASILENVGSSHEDHEDSNGGAPVRVFVELPSPSQEGGEGDGAGKGPGESDSGDGAGDGTGDGTGDEDKSESSDSKNDGKNDGKDDGKDGKDSESKGKSDGKASRPDGESQGQGSGKPEQGTASASNKGETVTISIEPDDGGMDESDDSFRKELNSIENQMAEKTANQSVESALQNTLQQNANHSATNDSYKIAIHRDTDPPQVGVQRYNSVWNKISPISKTLKKELLKILQERRQGTKLNGLIHGRRLDTRSLYRTDEKYFAKSRLPNDRPTVATALLIDQSGSMGAMAYDSSGMNLFSNKIQAASNAALLLYDFCTELDFPIMVAGHTTGGRGTVKMEVMASFQKKDKADRYRICAARSYGGNRDGTALNYMLSELKKRPEEIKLLFIISDGLPSDYGPNENGEEHVREVLRDAQKSGVLTFAAALNEDINSVKGIYGENMFEFTDLARMPRTLLNVMKRFVK